jgi:hypothetical protein
MTKQNGRIGLSGENIKGIVIRISPILLILFITWFLQYSGDESGTSSNWVYVTKPFDYTWIAVTNEVHGWHGPGYYPRFVTWPEWFNNIYNWMIRLWPIELLIVWCLLWLKFKTK